MKIIYKDSQIIVCHKPVGTICEGNEKNSLPVMLEKILEESGEKNTSVFPVHRLDKETVGAVVFARTPSAAAALGKSITEGAFEKIYLAVICGTPDCPSGEFTDLLYYDRSKGKSFVVDRKRNGVRSATLKYQALEVAEGFSLMKIRLMTGRTHQIRVQFSSRGLPLAGDRRYGAPKNSGTSMALCAVSLRFPHPKSGKALEFTAEPPQVFPWTNFNKPLDNYS